MTIVEKFKNREVKAKDIFNISEISKQSAYEFISFYHYLGDAKFFSKYNYGLFIGNVLVGVATYANPQGIVALKSWFGLGNDTQDVLELTRLCMSPELNGTNATSYLLGNSIKRLKTKQIRAIITLADDSRHSGSIYQVCNFAYYGKTDKKTDFYTADGKLNPRGTTRDVQGLWMPRTRKHRYAFILDKNLKCLLEEQERPSKMDTSNYECCHGSMVVEDKRFNVKYTCPICTGKIEKL